MKRALRALICTLFHWNVRRTPWGIHRYECECLRCGRTWAETE